MDTAGARTLRHGEVVLSCTDLDATLQFFRERLGFRIEAIFPADDPRVAVLSGAGLRLRLERGAMGAVGAAGAAGVLRLMSDDPALAAGGERVLVAPNGTRIELVPAEPPLALPPLRASFVLTRGSIPGERDADAGPGAGTGPETGASPVAQTGAWKVGRAGMEYRDLVPDRQGGRVIASHIRIRDGGPVPDYVHFHRVHVQLIHCLRGWVKVAYEDQGPPLVMHEGDCLIQPPGIRHRVLECSAGLQVVELTCPAEHETCADHVLTLPGEGMLPDRTFGGQRFRWNRAADASWQPSWRPGLRLRDAGMAAASAGRAVVTVARPDTTETAHAAATPQPGGTPHAAAAWLFAFVLRGSAHLLAPGHADGRLGAGDAFVVPAGVPHALSAFSEDFELLEVTLPDVVQPSRPVPGAATEATAGSTAP